MTQKGQHVHMVDGKTVPFDEATCPFCHPEKYQKSEAVEQKVYRKGDTIVMKITKGLMVTVTYWKDKNVFLMDMQKIQRDASGKVIRGQDEMPLWAKMTVRLSTTLAQEFVFEFSKLLSEVTQSSSVPQRA